MRGRDADVEPAAGHRRRSGAALAGAATVVEATTMSGSEGHIRLWPAHVMADPSNGQMTIYSNDMESYGCVNGVATFLAMLARQGPRRLDGGPAGRRTYGGGRCGFEAGISRRGNRPPVRMQWTRNEETAWRRKAGIRRQGRAGSTRRVTSSRSSTTRARPTTTTSCTTVARDRADRAVDGRVEGDAGGKAARRRRCTWTRSPTSASRPTSSVCRRFGETPVRTGNLAIRTGRSRRSPPSRSSTRWRGARSGPVAFRLKLLTASATDDSGFSARD